MLYLTGAIRGLWIKCYIVWNTVFLTVARFNKLVEFKSAETAFPSCIPLCWCHNNQEDQKHPHICFKQVSISSKDLFTRLISTVTEYLFLFSYCNMQLNDTLACDISDIKQRSSTALCSWVTSHIVISMQITQLIFC